MRLSETRDLFVSELTFPVRREHVVEELGDRQIHPPNGDPETIAEVLDRGETDTFRSSDELYDAIVGFVGDQFVGRKFNDDRGSNEAIDSEEVSF